jgi:hypothetical protein
LDIFNANRATPGTPTGSFVYFQDPFGDGNINEKGVVPIDATSGVAIANKPPDLIVIKSQDGSEFNFKSIYVNDPAASEGTIKFEGFRNGTTTGSVNLTINTTNYMETFNASNGLTASKFQNVDEVRISNQNSGDMIYGNYIGFNNIQIGDAVLPNTAPILTPKSFFPCKYN